jgi:uncharacterized protein
MTMLLKSPFKEVLDVLSSLEEDSCVPKNLKLKVNEIVTVLESDSDNSLKANKAIIALEEFGEDFNLQQYTRTQIWSIITQLESLR